MGWSEKNTLIYISSELICVFRLQGWSPCRLLKANCMNFTAFNWRAALRTHLPLKYVQIKTGTRVFTPSNHRLFKNSQASLTAPLPRKLRQEPHKNSQCSLKRQPKDCPNQNKKYNSVFLRLIKRLAQSFGAT